MLDFLRTADKQLFLFLNGHHNSFFDFVMYWASDRFIWIPFYVLLLFVIIKSFGRKAVVVFILIGIMITISDQVSSGLVKNMVHRFRPCHNPDIAASVHLVDGICGGSFGFFSSHASNTSALAVFLVLILRRKKTELIARGSGEKIPLKIIFTSLIIYVILVSYSRIYLGTHYPLDVFTGIVFGTLLSFIFAQLFFRLSEKKN